MLMDFVSFTIGGSLHELKMPGLQRDSFEITQSSFGSICNRTYVCINNVYLSFVFMLVPFSVFSLRGMTKKVAMFGPRFSYAIPPRRRCTDKFQI